MFSVVSVSPSPCSPFHPVQRASKGKGREATAWKHDFKTSKKIKSEIKMTHSVCIVAGCVSGRNHWCDSLPVHLSGDFV